MTISCFAREVDHEPATRLDTAYGSGLEPSEDGSSVAQLGRADAEEARERRDDPAMAQVVAARERNVVARRDESIMIICFL